MENTARQMMSAEETARRNPMRPPAHLPRDAASALRTFVSITSPRLLMVMFTSMLALRLYVGQWSWWDAVVVAALVAYWPLNEWLIHVCLLHYKPRVILGRRVDFLLPQTHRQHHADPWNLERVFIPLHIYVGAIPVYAALAWWGWHEPLVLSFATAHLCLALHYEWVHYLAHIHWCPPIGHYQKRVREHRLHHFRNENYWWGVSMGAADRWLGTAPDPEKTGRSGTHSTLGLGP
ncbi:MAG TPA: sterol desaturase family protein [Nevskiales bacterium]|nr:sterol desaturase family protein [Nevskiales bacterium]